MRVARDRVEKGLVRHVEAWASAVVNSHFFRVTRWIVGVSRAVEGQAGPPWVLGPYGGEVHCWRVIGHRQREVIGYPYFDRVSRNGNVAPLIANLLGGFYHFFGLPPLFTSLTHVDMRIYRVTASVPYCVVWVLLFYRQRHVEVDLRYQSGGLVFRVQAPWVGPRPDLLFHNPVAFVPGRHPIRLFNV